MHTDKEKDTGRAKILHILPIPFLPLIGPCLRCLRQLRALKEQGMDVCLISLKIRDTKQLEKLKDPIFNGINMLPILPNLPLPAFRELGTLFFSWRKLSKALDEIKPDIVQVHNPPDTLAFITSIVCSRKKIPFIYDIHDSSKEVIGASEFNPFLKKLYIHIALFFEKYTIKKSSGIVTVSESLKKLMLVTRSVFREYSPYFVVMRNVDESAMALLERETVSEENYIFYSGTLYSRFIGLEFLIDSLKNVLETKETKLYIAGNGPYRSILEKYITDNNLSDSIKLLGHINKNEIIGLIEKAKMTVIPYERNSLTEIALPNKLFEYMALGKPVVYPDFPGFREVLGLDNEGKYIPDDKDDLKRVVLKFLSEERLRISVGGKNKNLLKNITFEKEFSNLLNLYNKILHA